MYAKDKTTLIDRREMLRVKVKSLAEEARIIRREEKKSHGMIRAELYEHRIGIVRREARAACLALGLCKGRTIEQMEPTSKSKPDYKRVYELMRRYGTIGFVPPESWGVVKKEKAKLALAA